ncbi:MAG TPA: hypothetical protein PKD05_18200 [Candidatus Melainabacteria bacterium]|nr:hypothetical protein [Candidatus Melainabacteria bacterium]
MAEKENSAEKELTLLVLMHAVFAMFTGALLIYALVSPGDFAFMIEWQLGQPGRAIPPVYITSLLGYLGVLTVINPLTAYLLKSRKSALVAVIASVCNLFSVVGIPISLTTLVTLRKPGVKALFLS